MRGNCIEFARLVRTNRAIMGLEKSAQTVMIFDNQTLLGLLGVSVNQTETKITQGKFD